MIRNARLAGVMAGLSLLGCATSTPRTVFYTDEKVVREKVKEVALADVVVLGMELGQKDAESLTLIRRSIWSHLRTAFKVRDAASEDVPKLVEPYLEFSSKDGATFTFSLTDRMVFGGGFPEQAAATLCGTSDAVFVPIVMEGMGHQSAEQRWSAVKGASERTWASGSQPALLLLGVLIDCSGGVAWAEGIFLGYLASFSPAYVTGGIDQEAVAVSEILGQRRRRDHQKRAASLVSSLVRRKDPLRGDWD